MPDDIANAVFMKDGLNEFTESLYKMAKADIKLDESMSLDDQIFEIDMLLMNSDHEIVGDTHSLLIYSPQTE